MKKLLLIAVLIGIGVFIFMKNEDVADNVEWGTYNYSEPQYSLEYRVSPDGYVLEDFRGSSDSYVDLVDGVTLMLEEDYMSIQRGERVGGEGPPTINVLVFNNSRGLSAQAWVEANPQISNFPLKMGDYSNTTVDSKPAISYVADGLYASRNTLITHGKYIFFISGSYIDRDSDLYRDYDSLLETFLIN